MRASEGLAVHLGRRTRGRLIRRVLPVLAVLATQLPMSAASATPGDYTIVSLSDSGAQVTTNPHQPFGTHFVSDDGRFVVFSSDEQLASDSNAYQDVFVRDTVSMETEIVSISTSGVQGNAGSGNPSISADGRYVLFSSGASTLLPVSEPDTNGQFDLFLRDRVLNTTERVNLTPGGGQAQYGVRGGAQMSDDGRFVVFCSQSPDMIPSGDTNGFAGDVFVRDTVNDTTELVSVNSNEQQSSGFSWENPSISADGRYVTFRSNGPEFVTPTETNYDDDIFRRDRVNGDTVRVNEKSNGQRFDIGGSSNNTPVVSENGRFIVLQASVNDVVPEDQDNAYDVYIRDLQLGTLVRVGQPTVGSYWNGTGNGAQDALSSDGRFIVFSSGNQLLTTPNDPNGHADGFIRDLYTGEIEYLCATPNVLAGGQACWGPSISADGRFIAFRSGANDLATPDVNGVDDIFLYERAAAGPMDAPGIPWNVRATSSDEEAGVSWDPPLFEGASPITSYTVTASPGGANVTVGAGTTNAVVPGLGNGSTYTFTVRAENTQGLGVESAPSKEVIPGTPGAPTNVQAAGGPQEATVTWDPPASAGASPITSYTVTSTPHGVSTTVGAGSTTAVVTGLEGGTYYTFKVVATNAFGPGAASAASNQVVTTYIPFDPPTNVHAVAGNGEATVTWDPPTSTGGYPISGYEIFDPTYSGYEFVSGTTTSVVVSGLTNGTTYTFRVVAYNTRYDSSPASAPSNEVTPSSGTTEPDPPTNVQAVAGDGQASVDWDVPSSNGGSAITSYTVTAAPGGATVTVGAGTTTAVVTGLTNGTSYTFTVVATNAVGDSNPSAPSSAVTPRPLADLQLTHGFSPDPVYAGYDLTHTLRVRNLGPGNAGGVSLTETLPPGTVFASVASDHGSCVHASGTVTCTLGALPNDDVATIVIIATPTVSGSATLVAAVSTISIDNNASNDHISSPAEVSGQTCSIVGTQANDATLSGTSGSDVICGLGGNDTIRGLDGSDVLVGGSGTDTLFGGTNNDSLVGGAGNDTVIGDAGTGDIARFEASPAAINANFTQATGEGTDSMTTIEGLVGSPFADTLAGTNNPETLSGLGGSDTLTGSGGNDVIQGGAGADALWGGNGNDWLYGQGGDDTIEGGGGTLDLARFDDAPGPVTASLTGLTATGDGSDILSSTIEGLVGSPFDDSFVGGAGADGLYPLGGDDTLYGMAGGDRLEGGDGNDQLFAGDGNDTLLGQAGNDTFDGGSGVDWVRYEAATGGVTANLTDLTATGADGNDSFVGGSIENLYGSPFGDSLTGDAAANRLEGFDGNDALYGLAGADTLFGGYGNDILDGGAGNDTLNGGPNSDTCTQGPGGGSVSQCNP